MKLTMNSIIFADARIQGVTLRPVLGAYELLFGLYISVYADQDGPRRAIIDGARIKVKVYGGTLHGLGFARSDTRFEITTSEHPNSMTPALTLPLQPGQLAALERLRGASDLDFELNIFGTGTDQLGECYVQDTWRHHVPRSEWIKQLSSAKARDILLLEVPLPLRERSKRWKDIVDCLLQAEEHFRNGDYHSCVSACRTVVQELGQQKFRKKAWAGPFLNRLATERDEMSKREREAAIWGAMRHYTHQAHHGRSEGGETNYSRADAQLVLTLTASFVAHARSG